MSKRPHPTEDDVKRILAAKKRDRGKGACYPCNQRKVKCDMNKPCGTCLKRNHPDICIYSQDANRSRAEHQSRNTTQPSSPASESPALAATEVDSGDVASNSTSFLGENSTAAYLRRMGGMESPITGDIAPVLGLRNELGSYPFINAETADENSRELAKLFPNHQEILSFYHFYRAVSFPLDPIIVDIEDFEIYLYDFLESIAGSNASSKRIIHEKDDAAQTALLLATLSVGAQFSNQDHRARRKISRDFAKRSFHALRLANFLLRPLVPSLQALLILGTFLQNDGNSDAAWALLGTTMRLAQSLGLHSDRGGSESGSESTTEQRKLTGQRLWMMIVQQDCILSLCYDRPTATAYMPFVTGNNASTTDSLSYQESMWQITKLGLRLLATRAFDVDVNNLRQHLRGLHELLPKAAKHLQSREECRTLQERIQYSLFSLHRSFVAATICRPTFRSSYRTNQDPAILDMLLIGKNALADILTYFLDLHALTVYAIRSWVCVHEAISSALLLAILGETRKSSSLNEMQNRLITVLLSHSQDESPGENDNTLTSSHLNALKALQSLAQEPSAMVPPEISASETHPQNGPVDPVVPQYDQRVGEEADAAFNLWPTDLSPTAFLDSIIWDKSAAENDTAFLRFEFGG